MTETTQATTSGAPAAFRKKWLSSPSTKPTSEGKYSVLLPDGKYKRPNVLVSNAEEEKAARADGFTEEVADGKTVPGPAIQPKKAITLSVGSRLRTPARGEEPKKQTAVINSHDTVVDIFKAHRYVTDGSQVMLKPGTIVPFAMDDQPYDEIEPGDILQIVPNRKDQIGPFLDKEDETNANVDAVALQRKPSVIGVPANPAAAYPKLLHDPINPSRPDVLVHDANEEARHRGEGYTVEMAKPVPK